MKLELPERELKFAAKFGFITKPLWLRYFFEDSSKSWANERWQLLEKRGHFNRHPSPRAKDILVPNTKSELVRAICKAGVVSPPYLAQLDHDEILAEGLLSLSNSGAIASYLTEAEIKRTESLGIARTMEGLKLPDLIVSRDEENIAIELELTQKSSKRYRGLLNAYRVRKGLSAIVFIVPGRTILDCVVRASTQVSFPSSRLPIGFMSVNEWRKNAAVAEITFAKLTTTFSQFNVG